MSRALLLAVLLLAGSAHAGWVEVATPTGVPTDLTITDGGVLVLSTTDPGGVAEAWRVSDAGVALVASVPGPAIGAGLFGADCLAVARAASRGLAYSAPVCGVATAFGTTGSGVAFRLTPTITAATTFSTFAQLTWAPGSEGPWTAVSNFPRPSAPDVLQVARIGGVDVLAVNTGLQRVGLSVDGGAWTNQAAGAELRDVVPFERLGAPALVAVAIDGGLLVSSGIGTVAFQPAAMPTGEIARFVAMAGSRGVASTASGAVLSPIPDPARPGETWRVRAGAPPLTGRVHCADGRWCAGFAGNVAWALDNAAAPTASVAVPAARFGVPVQLVADAGDADGDPVFVSWSSALGAVTPAGGVPDGTRADLVPGCDAVVPIEVTVTDGVRSTTQQVTVPVERRGDLVVTGPASVLAGGDAGRFEVGVDGGCLAPAAVSWSSPTGQTGAGTTFDWTPPATACDASGVTSSVTATLAWPGGLGTSTATWDTLVLPWGAPEAPVFPAPARQRSGTSVAWYASGATHACELQPLFPGTELVWALDGGALATPIDGGLLVTAPSSCVASTERFVARRQVIGEVAGRLSAEGSLVVELTPDLDPLDAGTPFTVSATGDAGVFAGLLEVIASCLAQRPLEAEVTVSQGGVALQAGRFPAPGPWSLPVSGACLGGTFEISAALFEGGVDTGARATTSVTMRSSPVAIGDLAPATLAVQCGVGASGVVALAQPAWACRTADLTWRRVAGPELEVSSGTGERAALQTTARDWSAAGQALVLEWHVDGGVGNSLREARTVHLTVEPFLSTSVRLEPALVAEESVFRARVTVANPSACDVEGVELELPFSGATPEPGTVRVDGLPVEAAAAGGTLRLAGVAVPAGGAVEVSVLARPKLLGSPALAAAARLNGQLVSTDVSAPAGAPGCGCGTGGDAGLLLALLAFSRWRRRPARVGCRA